MEVVQVKRQKKKKSVEVGNGGSVCRLHGLSELIISGFGRHMFCAGEAGQ